MEDFRAQSVEPPFQLERRSPFARVSNKKSEKDGDTDIEAEVCGGSVGNEPSHNLICSPRYEASIYEISLSPLFSVFGRPLFSGGSSSLGGFRGHDLTYELEPLRVVVAYGIEWGEESDNVVIDYDKELGILGKVPRSL